MIVITLACLRISGVYDILYSPCNLMYCIVPVCVVSFAHSPLSIVDGVILNQVLGDVNCEITNTKDKVVSIMDRLQ